MNKEAEILIETKRFLLCPGCGNHKFYVDDLIGDPNPGLKVQDFGPWRCEKCGAGVEGTVEAGVVKAQNLPPDPKHIKHACVVVLRYHKLFLLVDHFYWGKWDQERIDSIKYWFNEHTCPTNFLGEVRTVYNSETHDADPHGVFEFVMAIPSIGDEEVDLQQLLDERKLLPENT